jgi:hypothetical protein
MMRIRKVRRMVKRSSFLIFFIDPPGGIFLDPFY